MSRVERYRLCRFSRHCSSTDEVFYGLEKRDLIQPFLQLLGNNDEENINGRDRSVFDARNRPGRECRNSDSDGGGGYGCEGSRSINNFTRRSLDLVFILVINLFDVLGMPKNRAMSAD